MKNMENDEDLLISLELQNFMDASQKKQSDQQRPQRLINQLTKIKNPVNLIQVATPETGQVFGHPQPAVLNRGRQMQQINQDLAQQLAISNSSQLAKVQVATPGTGQVFGNQQSDNSEQYRVKGATLSDLRKQRRRIQTNNEEVTASRQLRPSDQNLKQQLIQVGSSGSLIQVASPGAGQVFGHQQSDDSEQQQVKVEYHHGEVVARHQLRPSDQNLEQQLIQVGSSGNLIQVASPGAGQVFGHQQSDDFDENTGRRQLRPSDQNLKQQLTQVGSTGNLIQVASPGAGQVFGHQQSDLRFRNYFKKIIQPINVNCNFDVLSSSSIVHNGISYKTGNFAAINNSGIVSLYEILETLSVDDNLYLVLQIWEVLGYDEHFLAYETSGCTEKVDILKLELITTAPFMVSIVNDRVLFRIRNSLNIL